MSSKLPPFSIAEQDSSPTVWQPWLIQFPNGSVTDLGMGRVFVNTGAGGSGEILEARSPLLKAGTILSILTDGTTSNFLRGDGTYAAPPSGVAYAPSNATYIVQTNDAILSNEQVLAALSTGLVKNTAVTGVLIIAVSGTDYYNLPAQVDHNLTNNYSINNHFLQTSILNVNSGLVTGLLKITSATGLLSVAVSGTDYENALTVGSPLIRRVNVITVDTDASATTFLSGLGTFLTPVEARSPLLKSGSIMSLLTDGGTTTYLRGDGTYRIIYEARSPFLASGTILSILTDGSTTNFFRGDGTYAVPAGGGGGLTWGVISETAVTVAANSGYLVTTTALTTFTLPATSSIGNTFRIADKGVGLWKIAQTVANKIYFGHTSSTLGTAGYFSSADTGDCIELVCATANSDWIILSAIGNLTFV